MITQRNIRAYPRLTETSPRTAFAHLQRRIGLLRSWLMMVLSSALNTEAARYMSRIKAQMLLALVALALGYSVGVYNSVPRSLAEDAVRTAYKMGQEDLILEKIQ